MRTEHIYRRWNGWIMWLLDGLWLAGLVIYVLAGYDDVPFHGDESSLISMSRDYHTLVLVGETDPLLYTDTPDNPAEQELRILNGTVGKMAMGLAWDLAGYTVDDINEPWVWEWTLEQNRALGHLPGDGLLKAARLSSALLLALSVVIVFSIAQQAAGSRWAAWAASLIYATTPAVLLGGRRAMMDGALLCFSALTIWAALRLVRLPENELRRGTLIVWALALGALCGFMLAGVASGGVQTVEDNAAIMLLCISVLLILAVLRAWRIQEPGSRFRAQDWWWAALSVASGSAVASKHNGGIVVLAAFLAVLAAPLVQHRGADNPVDFHRFAGRILRLVEAGLWAVLVFLAWNPAWWANPFQMPEIVWDARTSLLDVQVAWYGGYDGLDERIEGLIDQAFFAPPQYYEVAAWQDYVGDQIETYRASGLAGQDTGTIWSAALIAACAAGLVDLLRRWRDGPALVVLLWLSVTALALLITVPLAWQRYYLPLYAPLAVVCGVGVWRIARVGWGVGRQHG
ncbi:MAG: glycosyltransferase family 39 protein [Anaerolineae bacterium]|nr:glycosyltransferase family 39 protein [Anaerolineae bacterium]